MQPINCVMKHNLHLITMNCDLVEQIINYILIILNFLPFTY